MKHTNDQRSKEKVRFMNYLKPVIWILIPVTCFLIPETHAALVYPLNDLKVIEAPISQTGLTRITVQDDRISRVFGMRGQYEMEADETSGQVFIRPQDHVLGPISLTLTTEGGHTQDLRLAPQNKAPEALILEKPESEKAQEMTQQSINRHDIEELLYACAEGRIPPGYHSVKLEIPNSDETYPLVSEITNGKLRGLTFEVKNWATIPWILAESGFAKKLGLGLDVVAVLMPKKLLNPGERMQVYVTVRSL